ncbi:MAG: hypothetical protein AB7N54_08290 [Alphaproteobacteria bacterium]
MPPLIDCDGDPYVPRGWTVAAHRRSGQLEWSPAAAARVLAAGRTEAGDGTPAPNANILDFLLAHPQHIPADWKAAATGRGLYVFFAGTTYRNVGGRLSVRYLCWLGDRWGWMALWLGFDSCCFIPAVLRRG